MNRNCCERSSCARNLSFGRCICKDVLKKTTTKLRRASPGVLNHDLQNYKHVCSRKIFSLSKTPSVCLCLYIGSLLGCRLVSCCMSQGNLTNPQSRDIFSAGPLETVWIDTAPCCGGQRSDSWHCSDCSGVHLHYDLVIFDAASH
jgi:hypothetical protein